MSKLSERGKAAWVTTKSLLYTAIVLAFIVACLVGGLALFPILLILTLGLAIFAYFKNTNKT